MKHRLIQIDPLLDLGKTADIEPGQVPDYSSKNKKWVPIVQEAQPAYDPDTEKLEPSRQLTDVADTRGWTIVPLTAEELADKTEEAFLAQAKPIIQPIVQKMKNNEALTNAERDNVLEFLLRLEWRRIKDV